ncbi:ADP-ribose 1''-phosphate phophatase related protein [uncultured Candidatus Thioglobus sp.]|nr:ADP-ribose 1''-phosphate phophatase related protein [uncultured Candidatus Thioglobus sp.]SMN01474.1 ADP-ribose 1''-phosphate phophatase related protein [uncultured Candidatus Thioglobus sp.]
MRIAKEINNLYYICHIDNLKSILENGLLSHNKIQTFSPKVIYDESIISRRKDIKPNLEKNETLWDFSNLYFNARNAMLYRVIHEQALKNVVIIQFSKLVLDYAKTHHSYISIGNAAHSESNFTADIETGLKDLKKIWSFWNKEYWNESDGSKRLMMSELIVQDKIPENYIDSIYVASEAIGNEVKELTDFANVITEPNMFFQPSYTQKLPDTNITLIQGDMFFSYAQTLTISVNTVGVMGKGLASRAKHQFPDMYVQYQMACKNNKIKAGKPWIYKREILMDEELADNPASLENPNGLRWFLLFPTKRHWRDNSRLDDIEQGLVWLLKNYRKEGITSLSLPALGCGLGQLSWQQVGPLMCQYLSQMNIPIKIYLPREDNIRGGQHLTKEFLFQE